ncbi:MAG: hypothetical protein JW776_12340 [Candidatus Lokiarchaeota archaeon]|nr:hypothetical protein [Candidatus Lokiarchaeota archaeon]
MEENVRKHSCIEKPRYFSVLIHRYLDKAEIPTENVVTICGFGQNGWNLPPEKVFDKIKDSIQEKYIKQIEEMNELTVDSIEGAKYIDLLMDSITIPNKKLFIGVAIASPFLHLLKKHNFLNPWISFIGPPGSGKTQMMEIMVKTLWNSFTVTGRNISSEARFDNYVSVSTLPIGIDDVNDIPKGMWGTLKSYHTNDVNVQKLSKTQKLLQDEQWLAPIIYTSNTRPEMFNDQGMNDRGVHFLFDSQPTDTKRFQKIKGIPYGYLGKCVIEFTKGWTEKEVLALFNSQEDAFPSDPRRDTIFKYFMFGAELTKKAFGKILFDDQAISRLKHLIQLSLTLGFEETLTTLIEQLREGRTNDRLERPYWIQSEIKVKKKYKSRTMVKSIDDAAVYTSDNYIDLKKRLNLQPSFNDFIKQLQRVWTDIPKTPQDKISIDGITKNAILIPKKHFL